jgi:hypothetical protein
MKKVLYFFSLVILIIITTFMFNKPKETSNDIGIDIITDKVFNNDNNISDLLKRPYDFNDFYLLFDEFKLNSKNFVNIFAFFDNSSEITVKELHPYINPLYQNNLNDYVGKITFLNKDLLAGLNTAYEKYINILTDYGYDEEISKIDINGIDIRMVLIHCSNQKLYQFLSLYPNIKYNLTIDNNYKKIKNN